MKFTKPFFTILILAFFAEVSRGQWSYELTALWNIPPGDPATTYEWVSTNNTHRGLAYNVATSHLVTVSRYPETNANVYVLDSNNGSALGSLNTNGIYYGAMSNDTFVGINFPLNMIGVANDGAIYACNLSIDTATNLIAGNFGPFRIYRWENENAAPTMAYLGDPSNADTNLAHRRFGDSIAVRGSGVNTEILAGTRQGKILARFITTDGINFTHQKIDAPDLTGVASTVTISFGAGDEFWIKTESASVTERPLQHFSFDPNSATATLIKNYTNFGQGGPLTFDPSRNLLAIIATRLHELRLFKITANGFVQQNSSQPFSTANANGNNTGSTAFSTDKLFALESNNGIVAFSISANSLAPFSVGIAADATDATLSWPSVTGFDYQLQYKDSLTQTSWENLGASTNGTGETISVIDPLVESRFYRIEAE